MNTAAAQPSPADRPGAARVAYHDRDFPFYNRKPIVLTGGGGLIVLIGVAAGIGTMMLPIPFLSSTYGQFIPAILFPGLPLAALALVAGRFWTALFARVGWRDIALTLRFGFLN